MCRTAVSVWMATNLGNSSTAYNAWAVSATCQTTTAAISIGLPSASLTLATAVSWLRSRTDTFRRRVNGFTNTSPASRTVPWYRPNSCTTRASPATTGTRPDSTSAPATSRMVAHPAETPLPALLLRADISSPIPTHRTTRPATRAKTPGPDQALCSASGAVAGLSVVAEGCMPIAGHLLLTCLTISTYHIDINLARRAAGVSDGKRAESTGNGAEGPFTGKLAVVTGGGSGMGRELVRQLAAQGCSVAACDWHADTIAATEAMARADAPPGVRVTGHACDVSDEAQVLRFRDELLQAHGSDHVDLVFSNAGIGGAASFVTDSREEWERTFAVDWWGTYYCARAFLPLLIASGDGVLVNTSSVNGLWASLGPGMPNTAYATAKFAVRGFSEALIEDLRTNAPGVRVVVVIPGHVGTDIVANSLRARGLPEPEQMSDAQLQELIPQDARARLIRAGLLPAGASAEQMRQFLARAATDFRDKAPVTAA